jgi:hypothetical protein
MHRHLQIPLSIMLLMAACLASSARAADRYVIEFWSYGPNLPTCFTVLWSSDVLFYNGSTAPATISLLGVSNGSLLPGVPDSFTMAPGETASLRDKVGLFGWVAGDISIAHIDVPDGVAIESRGELGQEGSPCGVLAPPEIDVGAFGAFSLPVYSALVPPGNPQIFLNTRLIFDSHVNVDVYNAAATQANATIEIHETCDDAVIDPRKVQIAPNTLVQYSGFETLGTCQVSGVPYRTFYVKVVVDQPSLAYLTEVSNQAPVPIPVGVSLGQ